MFKRNNIFLNQNRIGLIAKKDQSLISKKIADLNIKTENKGKLKLFRPEEISKLVTVFRPTTKKIKKKIHIFYNHKGGTGKTTLCTQMAYTLSFLGYRILIIDIDSQHNASLHFGITEEESENLYASMYNYFYEGVSFEDLIVPITCNLDLIPANQDIFTLEQKLITAQNRERKLLKLFNSSTIKNNYDFIFFDCHSAPTVLNTNAFLCADEINIITKPERFSVKGIERVFKSFIDFSREFEHVLSYGIIVNQYNNSQDHRRWTWEIENFYSQFVYGTVMRESADYNNANTLNQPILSISSAKSLALIDLISLVSEFIERSTIDKVENLPKIDQILNKIHNPVTVNMNHESSAQPIQSLQ